MVLQLETNSFPLRNQEFHIEELRCPYKNNVTTINKTTHHNADLIAEFKLGFNLAQSY